MNDLLVISLEAAVPLRIERVRHLTDARRLQLEERDGELAAARAANRELMAQLNVARHH